MRYESIILKVPNRGSVNFPRLRFPEFEGDWEVKKLGEIGEIVNGLTYSPSDIAENGVLVLRSSNVQNRSLTLGDNVYVRTNNYNPVQENDILICVRNGSKNLIGKNALINKQNVGVAFGAFMSIYRSSFNKFLFHWFDTNEYKEIVNKNLGATINSINGSDLRNFIVPFPCLEEQAKISSFLSLIDERIQTQSQIIEYLKTLKTSIAKKIFLQELRFKDDKGNDFPDWEEIGLENVCDIKKGEQFNKEELSEIGLYPCLNGGVSPSGFSEKFNSCENTITISEGGNSCGFVNFMKTKFWLGGHCYKILPLKKINLRYLYQLLKFNEQKIMNLRVGSGLPNIQIKSLKIFRINVSYSEKEQTKISQFLSSIDDKINIEIKLLQKLEEQKRYLLKNMFV